MKKRLLALFLCLVMCVGLLPASAFAQEDNTAGATDEILSASAEEPAEEEGITEEEEETEASEPDEMPADEAAEPEDGSDEDADPESDPDDEDASDEMPEIILAEQTIRATILAGDAEVNTLSVSDSVVLDGVMPEDAEVTASPVDVEIDGITVLAAYDIKIYDADGNPYQPQEGAIDVTISSPAIQTALEEDAVLSVYHMETLEDEPEEVDVISADEEGVEFAAESFSIYIVGEDGSLTDMEGQEHYVYTLCFFVESIDYPISTQTVSGGEHIEPPSVPDYEGYMFAGWYSGPNGTGDLYDFETYSLPEITDKQNHEIDLYAHYVPRVYVHYMTAAHTEGDDYTKVVFHTEAYDPGTALDTSRAEEYMLAKGYLSSVDTSTGETITDLAVTGWVDENGNAWKTGDIINADLELYPVIEEAYWIYFDMNGVQVVEEPAPEYVLAGSATIGEGVANWPDQITAAGYTFDGWYTAADGGVLVTANTDPATLPVNEDGTVTLYAHWSPAKVGYTVNIWRQKATDGQEGLDQKVVQDGEEYATYIQYYDYAESITISADSDIALTAGATGLTSSDFVYTYTTGSGRTERTYTDDYWSTWTGYGWTSRSDGTGNYVGFEYNQARTENNLATITVKADGSTVINIFYDRVTITYNFGSGTSGSSITTYGTLIGLYDTNIKVDADNAAGTLNEWPDPPGTNQEWKFSYSQGQSRGMSFLAKYTLESNTVNNSNVVNFTASSTNGTGTLYYYLEVTDPDRQVTSSSTTKTMRNDITYVLDQTVSVPTGTFYFSDKYIGYEYYGYTTANNTTTITTTGTSRRLSSGGSLYIFNKAIEYTLELYSNHNGEQLIWSDDYKYGTPMSSDILPTELDAETYGPAYYYHFTGIWYEDPTFTAEFIMPDNMPANNLVAYADWELNDVVVTFETGTDSVEAPETQYIKATETAQDPGVLEREGYTHVGWVDQNGKVFNFDTVLYTDTVLTAIWKSDDVTGYVLTYDLNVDGAYGLLDDYAGETESTNPEHFAGDDYEELWTIEHAFSGLGSEVYDMFICWNTKPDGSGTSYYPDDEIYIEGDTTLYAIWAHENQSTLILDHNYPDGYVYTENDSRYDEVTQKNLDSIELDEVSTLVVGDEIEVVDEYGVTHTYRFAGWSTVKTDADEATDEDVEFDPHAVIAVDNTEDDETGNTLYAVWVEVPTIPITVEKIWKDGENETNVRPDSVTVTLYADGDEVESAALTAENDWSYTFSVLEEDYGEETVWTVAEDEITLENDDHYETEYSVGDDGTLTITNTLTGTWDSVSVEKVWEDNENHDDIRPESVEIGLFANGKAVTDEEGEIVEVVLSEENRTASEVRTWAGSFSDLPKYDENGKLIEYTVTELEIPNGYTSVPYGDAETGFVVVNTHDDYMATITVTKTWDDGEWGDIYRPDEVTVHLYADGTELDENTEPPLVLTKDDAVDENTWTGTFEKSVYVYEVTSEGTIEVSYTVNEDDVEAYVTTKNGVVTLTPDEDSETGWSGSVTITNHLETIDDEPGEEPEPGGGDEGIIGPVTISKTWVDEYDTHDSINVTIFSSNWQENGKPVISKTVTLGEDNDWTAVIEGLPKYETDGTTRIEYEVTEIEMTGYETTGGILEQTDDGTYAAEFVNTQLINTGNDDPTDDGILTVTKVWDDNEDQDGMRPTSVRVALSVNGHITDYVITLYESNNWTGTFVGLPAYQLDEDGNAVPVEYTVVEAYTQGYTGVVSGSEETGYVFEITNTHKPILINEEEDDDPDNDGVLTVTKEWDDNNNQDGKRPGSVTVNLLADGEKIDEMTLTAATGWTGSFTGLEKYRDGGVVIEYTVTETAVDGYSTSYDEENCVITNSYTPSKTSVTVVKAWDDGNDWDGIRPDEVEVTLYANGEKAGTLTLAAEDDWVGSFTELDEYAGGEKIIYTVTETDVPDGYTSSVSGNAADGYVITNAHEPVLINTEDGDPNNDGKISVEKVWNDANDQDGMRPESVTIVLTGTVGENEPEVVVEKSAELTGNDGWAYTFGELYKYHDGEEVTYTITEIAAENYDEPVIEGNIADGFTITNTHEPVLVNTGDDDPDNDGKITITKVWDDEDNQDGIRPDTVTVNLLANGVPVESAELAPERTGLFARILAFFTGKDLSEENGWSFTFEDLPMYSGGKEIEYTVEEVSIDGYDSEITGNTGDGFTITNSHEPVLINTEDDDPDNDGIITVTKVWDDNDNQDGKRPSEITVSLLDGTGEVADTLVLNEENGWTGKFTDLYAYANGKLLTYTVTESAAEGYYGVTNGSMRDGYTITNTYEPELINQGTKNEGTITVTKVWNDNDDQDGIRPDEVTVFLLTDGEVTDTLTLSEKDGWEGAFEGLYAYADGKLLAYTVAEDAVNGYTAGITGSTGDGYTITNTHEPVLINTEDDDPDNDGIITVTKVWNDDNDRDGMRPDEITVSLLDGSGKVADTLTLSEKNGWEGAFEGLYAYADGKLLTYTVIESGAEGYYSVTNGGMRDGYTITNTYDPELINQGTEKEGILTVTKVWDDNNDQDGLRPDEITVSLLDGSGKVADTMVLSDGNGWTGTFEGLYAYANGQLLNYTVIEDAVDGYCSVVNGSSRDGYTITNTHDPILINEDDENPDNDGVISVEKVWLDNNNADDLRPTDGITVILYADGEYSDSLTLNEAGGWAGSFTDLPAYSGGKEISYTISEIAAEGYKTEVTGSIADGYVVTNTQLTNTGYDPTDPDDPNPDPNPRYDDDPANDGIVSVEKVWADNNNADNLRPDSVEVILYAGGEAVDSLTLTAAEDWTGSFTDLPKYDEDNNVIIYTVSEIAAEGYKTEVTGTNADGYTVTNTQLTNTGTDPTDPSPNPSPDPDPDNDGIISVEKVWVDGNDADGLRADSVTVALLADGKTTGDTLVLNAGNGWSGSFTDLPKYDDNNKAIVYGISEVSVDGYKTEVTGTNADGYIVTNTQLVNTGTDPTDPDPNPEPDPDPDNDGVITVEKVWSDADNADNIRPDSVTVTLLANGAEVDSLTLSAENGWTGAFTDLPKYGSDNEVIIYTVSETGAEGYKAEVTGSNGDGYTVTNVQLTNTGTDPTDPSPNPRPDPDPANDGIISVEKVWVDGNNADGLRPESITVALIVNGEVTENTLELNEANGWSGSFTDLPKYDDNDEVILYSVTEIAADGYKTEVTGSNADGYIVTNTQLVNTGTDPTDPSPNPRPDTDPDNDGTITVEKVWVDGNNADNIRPDSITVTLLADGEEVSSLTLSAENGWTGTFTDLPKYGSDNEAINYTVTESGAEGYKSEVTGSTAGFTVTNTQLTNTGTDPTDPDPNPSPDQDPDNDGVITVKKVWNDGDNENNARPDMVIVTLTADGEAADMMILSERSDWTGSFTDLAKYNEDGSVIVYGISEVNAAGYSSEITGSNGGGYTVTNTLLVNGGGEDLSDDGLVTVSKVWKDDNDSEGLRPEEITVTLYADGEDLGSLALTAEDGWTGSFEGLPAYGADGEEIIYTVTESEIILDSEDAYVASYDYDGQGSAVITNTLTGVWGEEPGASGEPSDPDNPGASGNVGVTVEKVWQDNNDQDGLRPAEVDVTLFADGEDTGLTVTLSEASGWTGSFGTLNKYDEDGVMVDYAVTENDVPEGYISTAGGSADAGFTVTNIHDPALVNGNGVISVTKTWDDNDNALGVRSDEVVLQLTANGEPVENMTLTLTAADNWTGSFTGLPACADGTEIVYSVTETEGSHYYDVTVETLYGADGTYSLGITNQIDLVFFPIDEEIVVDEDDPDSWIGNESVNEYEMIEIEMTTTLPVVSGEELANGEFTMTFHDVLASALNLDETDADFSVYIAGIQVDHQYYTVILDTDDDCSFHVTVDLTALYNDGVITDEDLQGDTEITVFFYADLEGTGLNGSYTSTVWYDVYDGDELLYTSNEDVVEFYTFDIDIIKYDASVLEGENYADAALAGATLGVFYDKDCTEAVVRTGNEFEATSAEDGLALFSGLAEGTYYVKEIQAPDGYELSDEVLEVTLSTDLEDHVSVNVFANTPAESETPAEPEAPAETTEPEATAEPEAPAAPAEPEQTEEPEPTAEPTEPEASEEPADETPAESDETASAEPVTEGTSGGSGTASGESSSPQTGDENSLLFFAAMILLCGAAMICLVVVRRKRTDK